MTQRPQQRRQRAGGKRWPDHLTRADVLVQRVSDDAGYSSDVQEADTGPSLHRTHDAYI